MSDLYARLVDHTGYLVYRKTKIDFVDDDDRWTENEFALIKPAIIHLLNGGKRQDFAALSDKRLRQIEIRLTTAYVDLEDELKGSAFPFQSTEWFAYRLKEERKNRLEAGLQNSTK